MVLFLFLSHGICYWGYKRQLFTHLITGEQKRDGRTRQGEEGERREDGSWETEGSKAGVVLLVVTEVALLAVTGHEKSGETLVGDLRVRVVRGVSAPRHRIGLQGSTHTGAQRTEGPPLDSRRPFRRK